MRILLAEDSDSQRKIFVAMFKKLGYENIAEASDGAIAWELLSQQPYDMLVTDWNMPNMNGLELLTRVRATPHLVGMPILMVTTVNDQQSIISAMRAGVSNYLTKPFTPDQLKGKMDKALANAVAQMGKEAEDLLENGRQHFPASGAPYVIGPLEAGATKRLTQGQDRALMQFLKHIINAIGSINREYPALNLGYCFDENNQEIVNRLRLTHEKTRTLFIWTTPAYEKDGLTMARLIGRNQQDQNAICLFCDRIDDLPGDVLDVLRQSPNVKVMEKTEAELAGIEKIIRDGILQDLSVETGPA